MRKCLHLLERVLAPASRRRREARDCASSRVRLVSRRSTRRKSRARSWTSLRAGCLPERRRRCARGRRRLQRLRVSRDWTVRYSCAWPESADDSEGERRGVCDLEGISSQVSSLIFRLCGSSFDTLIQFYEEGAGAREREIFLTAFFIQTDGLLYHSRTLSRSFITSSLCAPPPPCFQNLVSTVS